MSIFEDTFLVGDSQEVLKEVDDGIVHLTCTSPPYYNARAYSTWPTYDAVSYTHLTLPTKA